MVIRPIIPIWLMVIVSIVYIAILLNKYNIRFMLRQIIGVILIFAVNLRVMVPDDNITYQKHQLGTNVVFVVDTTISMLANDYKGNSNIRLDGAKEDILYIMDKLDGAKFMVMVCDNNARVLTPYTRDKNFVDSVVKGIYSLSLFYANGSSFDDIEPVLQASLDNTKSQEKKRGESNDIVVFYMSDGEITREGGRLGDYSKLGKSISNGAVLGYGTTDGGTMRVLDMTSGIEEDVYDKEERHKQAISRIDESNLSEIAKDMGIRYINMNTGDKREIDRVIEEVLRDSNETLEDEDTNIGYKDIYQIFLIPYIIVQLIEISVYIRKRNE